MSDTTSTEARPAIPASCAHRPVVGGLVAPVANIRLADGSVDFRTPHQGQVERCWAEGRCQVCGDPIVGPAILFGGPRQLAARHFDEPPMCVPCALYASRACPMVAGRRSHYAARERLSEGARGHACPDAGCDCGGFVASGPDAYDASDEPAHTWYAVYVRPGAWQLTGKTVTVACSDRGCLHDRTLVNGAILSEEPLKVILVSTQVDGRTWRRLDLSEVPDA